MTAMPDLYLSCSRENQVGAKLFAEAFAAQRFKVWWNTALKTGEASLRGSGMVCPLHRMGLMR
jgi:hypothetical protein